MKKIIVLILAVFLFLVPSVVEARLLPRVAKTRPASGAGSNAVVARASRGVSTSVRFRSDRLAILVTLTNLQVARNVSYVLTYNANGVGQGAQGNINPVTASEPVAIELPFGTCSSGVCRYDSGVTNARLVVTTTLTSGRKVVKPFRLRV